MVPGFLPQFIAIALLLSIALLAPLPVAAEMRTDNFRIEHDSLGPGGISSASGQFDIWGCIDHVAAGAVHGQDLMIWAGCGVLEWHAMPIKDGPDSQVPRRFAVLPNAPNPFSTSTRIQYELPEMLDVSVSIYSPNGRLMREIALGVLAAGLHGFAWDGRDESGNDTASGVYFYELIAGSYRHLGKMLRIK